LAYFAGRHQQVDVVIALIALLARLMHSHKDSDLKAIH
jgi:hypothetical protein